MGRSGLTARCSDIGPRCLLGVWRLIQKLAQKLTLPVKYAISKNPANWVNLTATRYYIIQTMVTYWLLRRRRRRRRERLGHFNRVTDGARTRDLRDHNPKGYVLVCPNLSADLPYIR